MQETSKKIVLAAAFAVYFMVLAWAVQFIPPSWIVIP